MSERAIGLEAFETGKGATGRLRGLYEDARGGRVDNLVNSQSIKHMKSDAHI